MRKLALLKEIEKQLIRIAAVDYKEYMKAHPRSKKTPNDPLFQETKKSPSTTPSTTPSSKPSQPSEVKKRRNKKRAPSALKPIRGLIDELDSSHSMRFKSYNINPRKKLITYQPYEGGSEGEIERFFKEKGGELNLKGWKVKLETSHWGDGAKSKMFSIRPSVSPKTKPAEPVSKTKPTEAVKPKTEDAGATKSNAPKTKIEDFSDDELKDLGLDRKDSLHEILREHNAKKQWNELKKSPKFEKFNPFDEGDENDWAYSDRVQRFERRETKSFVKNFNPEKYSETMGEILRKPEYREADQQDKYDMILKSIESSHPNDYQNLVRLYDSDEYDDRETFKDLIDDIKRSSSRY